MHMAVHISDYGSGEEEQIGGGGEEGRGGGITCLSCNFFSHEVNKLVVV